MMWWVIGGVVLVAVVVALAWRTRGRGSGQVPDRNALEAQGMAHIHKNQQQMGPYSF